MFHLSIPVPWARNRASANLLNLLVSFNSPTLLKDCWGHWEVLTSPSLFQPGIGRCHSQTCLFSSSGSPSSSINLLSLQVQVRAPQFSLLCAQKLQLDPFFTWRCSAWCETPRGSSCPFSICFKAAQQNTAGQGAAQIWKISCPLPFWLLVTGRFISRILQSFLKVQGTLWGDMSFWTLKLLRVLLPISCWSNEVTLVP